MTIADLGSLGEFIGSFAVLATLVYLSIQTKQTKDTTRQLYVLNKSDQRIRGNWADRDSPYMAAIYVKAENGEPFTQEDEFRIERTISIELVRLRVSYSMGEHKIAEMNGVNLASLKRLQRVFPELTDRYWEGYIALTDAPEDFIAWVEGEIPEMKRASMK